MISRVSVLGALVLFAGGVVAGGCWERGRRPALQEVEDSLAVADSMAQRQDTLLAATLELMREQNLFIASESRKRQAAEAEIARLRPQMRKVEDLRHELAQAGVVGGELRYQLELRDQRIVQDSIARASADSTNKALAVTNFALAFALDEERRVRTKYQNTAQLAVKVAQPSRLQLKLDTWTPTDRLSLNGRLTAQLTIDRKHDLSALAATEWRAGEPRTYLIGVSKSIRLW